MFTRFPATNKNRTVYLLANGIIMGLLMILIHQLRHSLHVHTFPEREPWYSEYEPFLTYFLSYLILAGAPLWNYRIKVDAVSKCDFFLFWETGLLIFTVYYILIGYRWYPGFLEMDIGSYAKLLKLPSTSSLVYAIVFLKDVLKDLIFMNGYLNLGYILPLVFIIQKYRPSFSRFALTSLFMVVPAVTWDYVFSTIYRMF